MADRVSKNGSFLTVHSYNKNEKGEWVDWNHVATIDLEGKVGSNVNFEGEAGEFFRIQLFKGVPGDEHKGVHVLDVTGKVDSISDRSYAVKV